MQKTLKLILMLLCFPLMAYADINFDLHHQRVEDGHRDFRVARIGITKSNNRHWLEPQWVYENQHVAGTVRGHFLIAPDPAGTYIVTATCFDPSPNALYASEEALIFPTFPDNSEVSIDVQCELNTSQNRYIPTINTKVHPLEK